MSLVSGSNFDQHPDREDRGEKKKGEELPLPMGEFFRPGQKQDGKADPAKDDGKGDPKKEDPKGGAPDGKTDHH